MLKVFASFMAETRREESTPPDKKAPSGTSLTNCRCVDCRSWSSTNACHSASDATAIVTLAVDEGPRHAPERTALTAEKACGGAYTLNGRKVHVLEGLSADVFIVAARTSGAPGTEAGISLFVLAGLISTCFASDRRAALSDLLVQVAPMVMAWLLIQWLNTPAKIRLTLALIVEVAAAMWVLVHPQCPCAPSGAASFDVRLSRR